MSFQSELDTFYKAGTGLDTINGLWQDKVPTDHASTYPLGLFSILPTSGRLRRTFGSTTYESIDVRFEVYATTQANALTIQAAMQTRFESAKPSFSTIQIRDCERTASFVRYAGKDTNGQELWVAVYTCRFTIQN